MSLPAGSAPAADAVIQVERQRQRLQALQQVSLAASRVVDPSDLARICLDQTIRILSAERVFLFLTDGHDALVAFLGRNAAGEEVAELTGYSASLVQRVHIDGRPLVVTGTDQGAALGAQSVVLHGLRSILIAPLMLEQRRLGVVYLDSQIAKGIFTSDDVDILTALTTHIATALETARAAQLAISVRTAQHERDLAEHLREAAADMTDAGSPQAVLDRLIQWTRRLTRCDAGWVLIREPGGLRLHTSPTQPGKPTKPRPPAAPGSWPCGPIEGHPELAQLLAAPGPVVGPPERAPAPVRKLMGPASWLALPLRASELDTGLLLLRSDHDRPEEDVNIASALVAQAIAAYDRAALFARVQALAVADELTGLANRRHFFDVARRDVEESRRDRRPPAVIMLDIDHFKAVNDTYGHPTGDDVIRVVAQRLAEQVRTTDLVGRYGGEEFAIVMLDAAPPHDMPERVRTAVSRGRRTTR